MNDATFALWARILRAVPGSRLLLRHVAFAAPGVRAGVLARLARAGLGDEAALRVRIDGPVPNALAMMPLYHELDIALDTFPYGGMTTTCEALTMGVPTVTLALDRAVSRCGLAILANCGLEELVARTPDEYVRIAVDLAGDPARLAAIRDTARARMARVVTDAPAFAERFERALRAAWREWCACHRPQL